jgi:methyltransferase (TIGR00027 family)
MLPVSNTAYFCCGIRCEDEDSKKSVVNDIYAKKFMSEEGMNIYSEFKKQKYANRNILVRHKLIDDMVSSILSETEDVTFISIGSGLESRSYRMSAGSWIEIDEHQVITYKEKCLPQNKCKNKLKRIGVDFSINELSTALSSINVLGRVVVIIEGVFVYLDPKQILKTLNSLKECFPDHDVITDFISEDFINSYSKRFDKGVNELGAYYSPLKHPESPFIDGGYKLKIEKSVTESSTVIYGQYMLRGIAKLFMPNYINGYKVALLSQRKTGGDNAFIG